MIEHIQFNIRIPKPLKDELDKSARLNNRSTSAEAVARLAGKNQCPCEQVLLIVREIRDAVKHD